MQIILEKIIPIIEIIKIKIKKFLLIIFKKYVNPKVPNFNNNPAKIILDGVEASTWTLGNQKWNKKKGIFIKIINKNHNKKIGFIFNFK